MAIIQKEIELAGSKARIKTLALFDSGATYSIIIRSLAEGIGIITPSAEKVVFETAKPAAKIESEEVVQLFFWIDGYRLSDEFFVVDSLSEEVIIGAATLQKWRLKLDFENDRVIINPEVTRLRLLFGKTNCLEPKIKCLMEDPLPSFFECVFVGVRLVGADLCVGPQEEKRESCPTLISLSFQLNTDPGQQRICLPPRQRRLEE